MQKNNLAKTVTLTLLCPVLLTGLSAHKASAATEQQPQQTDVNQSQEADTATTGTSNTKKATVPNAKPDTKSDAADETVTSRVANNNLTQQT